MGTLARSKDEGPGQELSREKGSFSQVVKVWKREKLKAFKSLATRTKKEGERERKTLSQ